MLEKRRTGSVSELGDRSIRGKIPLFNNLLTDGQYWERFDRTAFDGVDLSDVVFNLEHDNKTAVAKVSAGNLDINFDNDGLVFEARVIKGTTGDEVIEKVRNGVANQASIRYWHAEEDTTQTEFRGLPLVIYNRIRLLKDVCCTPQGSWSGQTITRTQGARKNKIGSKEMILLLLQINENT